jgi:hypothetical protein
VTGLHDHPAQALVFAFGSEPPLLAIHCDAAGDGDGDIRWFSAIFVDAPPPDEQPHPPEHAACFIEEFPEAGRGMDLAVEHRWAVRDPITGTWALHDGDDFTEDDVAQARERIGWA